jgi:hypothetical protein
MRALIAILLAATIASSIPARTMIRLEGQVPADIDARYLESQFGRICHQVAPRYGCGREPLRVIFYSAQQRPELAGRLPEWGGGGAINGDTAIVAIDKPFVLNYDLARIAVHEIVHCALMRVAGTVEIPRWFHEGVAMTLAGEISFEEQVALSYAVLLQRIPGLASIETVNAHSRESATVSYSLSHAIALFMVDKWGIDAIGAIVDAAVSRSSFEMGLQDATGLTMPEFELLVTQYVRSRYGLAFVLGDLAYMWIIVLVVAIVAFFAVRHRNRKRKAEMEVEETARRSGRHDTPVGSTPPPPPSLCAPQPDPQQFPPLPPETEDAADLVAEWAQTWRYDPESAADYILAVWFQGDCLRANRPAGAPLQVVVEFDPHDDDDDEELSFERFAPLWHDSLRETLGELLDRFGGLRVVPCYSDDDALFAALEREGLLVFEREDA